MIEFKETLKEKVVE